MFTIVKNYFHIYLKTINNWSNQLSLANPSYRLIQLMIQSKLIPHKSFKHFINNHYDQKQFKKMFNLLCFIQIMLILRFIASIILPYELAIKIVMPLFSSDTNYRAFSLAITVINITFLLACKFFVLYMLNLFSLQKTNLFRYRFNRNHM